MQKLKQNILFLLAMTLLMSCGPYQKVLNKGTATDQYKMATDLYNKGEYSKALPLLDKVVPEFTGKPQMERIQFMVAQSHYMTKDYTLSGYYFNRFANNYPKSSKREEALFLAAKGYYMASPKYSLDQTDTFKAIDVLQQFINQYPNSDKLKEANDIYDILNKRIEKKHFEIAKQYFLLEKYNAAIVAFDNFLEDYTGTSYKEQALYLQYKAAYNLATKSVLFKKEGRLKNAIKMYSKFIKEYPNSEYLKDMNSKEKILNQQLKTLTK